ncbi:cupin domain-containing protein [Sporosarcina siberiensis]|uniref:Cupin domain-containing protein n=1 Tax=Sporosarcina siberiensis TaxID=1365606 RepID=A0ABW4SIB8_9BACL
MEKQDENSMKLLVSRGDAPSVPDRAAKGAVSRWLQTDSVRMRLITFPPGYEGDHVCYKGHSIYVISGLYKMDLGDSQLEWREGDAFIIPDDVPHRSFNPGESEAKIIMFDNHT